MACKQCAVPGITVVIDLLDFPMKSWPRACTRKRPVAVWRPSLCQVVVGVTDFDASPFSVPGEQGVVRRTMEFMAGVAKNGL